MAKEESNSGWHSQHEDVELDGAFFDPNNARYKCFCKQCHSTVGVKIIAGLLSLTVLLELWGLIWQIFLSGNGPNNSSVIISSVFQLMIGISITGSVIYALKTENAAFLSPYLLMQVFIEKLTPRFLKENLDNWFGSCDDYILCYNVCYVISRPGDDTLVYQLSRSSN
jgi:hypothetical protein